MVADSAVRTLWEDWQARRERLEGQSGCPEPYRRLQIQILDYLLRRYRDSPEAARPARAPLKADLFVNQRAIVVHHHVWRGRVGGVKSRQEAQDRVASILRRMQSPTEDEDDETPPDFTLPSEPTLRPEWFSAQKSKHVRRIRRALRLGVGERWAIERALRANPILWELAVKRLYERVADLERENVLDARLLVRCENRSAMKYAFVAWRDRVEAGRIDEVTTVLETYFRERDVRGRVSDTIRTALANDDARVRLRAIGLLAGMGCLDDIGLLSDLLSLPPLEDENPIERRALAEAMERIARGS